MSTQTSPQEIAPIEEEPDDGSLLIGYEPGTSPFNGASAPSRISADQYLQAGIEAFSQAEASEQIHGLNEDTVDKYRAVSENFSNYRFTVDASYEYTEPTPADAARITIKAISLAKQARASEVAPYKSEDYQPGGHFADIDREAELLRAAHSNLEYAKELFVSAKDNPEWTELFEEGSPILAVAEAAVKASLSMDTLEYKLTPQVIREETSELLERRGMAGVDGLVQKETEKKGARFMELFGRNILNEMVDSPREIVHV